MVKLRLNYYCCPGLASGFGRYFAQRSINGAREVILKRERLSIVEEGFYEPGSLEAQNFVGPNVDEQSKFNLALLAGSGKSS